MATNHRRTCPTPPQSSQKLDALGYWPPLPSRSTAAQRPRDEPRRLCDRIGADGSIAVLGGGVTWWPFSKLRNISPPGRTLPDLHDHRHECYARVAHAARDLPAAGRRKNHIGGLKAQIS